MDGNGTNDQRTSKERTKGRTKIKSTRKWNNKFVGINSTVCATGSKSEHKLIEQ